MKIFKKVFQLGDHEVSIETGGIARQANGSVMIRVKDTAILATVCAAKEPKPGVGFFPLTVNYVEKMYAAGRIPGGFFKREGRPGEHETLISRLIDRPIRPLFPKDFRNDVQVVLTVMSSDPDIQSDIFAMIAASAALSLSGIPFQGPIGAARVGYADDKFLFNPSLVEQEDSQLDLVVAGTKDAVLMVESEAKELPEDTMLAAVMFGHEQMQVAIKAIEELTEVAGKPRWEHTAKTLPEAISNDVKERCFEDLKAAYEIKTKQERYASIGEITAALDVHLEATEADEQTIKDTKAAFAELEKNYVRQSILDGKLRIDGRDTRTVRPIHIETEILARTHGSAIFTRGETQAIVAATLGTERDAQILDNMHGESRDNFMLHYNFPPYSVGETGMMGSPKRREIGHGKLAKRAIAPVLPSVTDFPYTLRLVSEITESNGSSSMATVCGSSLALMDAGVPIKAPVAGIAMGLIKEGDQFAVLTDILGDEDHLGDMDFKVAGTANGVTALQMDIKITGINKTIMEAALTQAKEGRLHILGLMNDVINLPRTELSTHAPRITTIKIHPDKIRDVIGKGGATIKSITEKTGVNIDLEDDGTVKIYATDEAAGKVALEMIDAITADAEINKVYLGTVARLADFGAFVNILPGKDGLVHISQIMEARVENVADHLSVGDKINVRVMDIDRQGRIKLTMRGIDDEGKKEGGEGEEQNNLPSETETV